MINYQPITKNDLSDLVDLFNSVFIHDKITQKLLDEKIFGEKDLLPEATLKVLDGDSLIGFAVGFVRMQNDVLTGWIKLLACKDQSELGPVTLNTYKKIESILIDKGVKLLRFFDSFPNYYFPGIDPRYTSLITLVETNGYFKQRDNVNMIANLDKALLETKDLEKNLFDKYGTIIRRAAAEDYKKIMNFIEKDFPLWTTEVANSYKQNPVAVHIALENNYVIAFSGYHGNNVGTGWFGPMGTTPSCRGKGIGGILLKRCLKDLKDQGYSESIIPWVGPIPFYFREVNAIVDRVFWNYRKTTE